MALETIRPEFIQSLVVLVPFAVGVLSAAQRRAILQRDKNRCQVPIAHKCNGNEIKPNGEKNLQVDHLIPQRFGQAFLGLAEIDLDQPINLLTECEYFHQHIRHPDMEEQRLAWRIGKHDNRVFKRRSEFAQQGKIYWNPVYDDDLKAKAQELTLKAPKDWKFPEKKHRNGKN